VPISHDPKVHNNTINIPTDTPVLISRRLIHSHLRTRHIRAQDPSITTSSHLIQIPPRGQERPFTSHHNPIIHHKQHHHQLHNITYNQTKHQTTHHSSITSIHNSHQPNLTSIKHPQKSQHIQSHNISFQSPSPNHNHHHHSIHIIHSHHTHLKHTITLHTHHHHTHSNPTHQFSSTNHHIIQSQISSPHPHQQHTTPHPDDIITKAHHSTSSSNQSIPTQHQIDS